MFTLGSSNTNLKDGNGKPCAGQTSVTVFDSCLVIPFEFISSENFGFALPMGSEQLKLINEIETFSALKCF